MWDQFEFVNPEFFLAAAGAAIVGALVLFQTVPANSGSQDFQYQGVQDVQKLVG